MFFRQRGSSDGASLAYMFGCGGKGKAVVVDVIAGDEDWFIQEAQVSNVDITCIHADHYSGGRTLAEQANAHKYLRAASR